MKKSIAFILVCAVMLAFSAPVFADHDPIEKLKNGSMDVVKSPMQVYDHTKMEYESAEFKPFGLIGGFLKGVAYMGKDIVTGVVDVVTFPLHW